MGMKETYQAKMEAQLKEWQAKIDVLKAKAEKAEADAKIRYNEEIESLQAKQHHMAQKLDELRSSSESAWEDVKAGVEMAWKDLKHGVEHAMEKFKREPH